MYGLLSKPEWVLSKILISHLSSSDQTGLYTNLHLEKLFGLCGDRSGFPSSAAGNSPTLSGSARGKLL